MFWRTCSDRCVALSIRNFTSEHFIQDFAKSINVGLSTYRFVPLFLLRRSVLEICEPLSGSCFDCCPEFLVTEAGHTKIGYSSFSWLFSAEEILGLEIAMNYAFQMGCLDTIQHRRKPTEHLRRLDASLQPLAETPSVERHDVKRALVAFSR